MATLRLGDTYRTSATRVGKGRAGNDGGDSGLSSCQVLDSSHHTLLAHQGATSVPITCKEGRGLLLGTSPRPFGLSFPTPAQDPLFPKRLNPSPSILAGHPVSSDGNFILKLLGGYFCIDTANLPKGMENPSMAEPAFVPHQPLNTRNNGSHTEPCPR